VSLPPLLVQTAGSLLAILVLAGLARWLGLGGAPRLASEADVCRAAGEVDDGFAPVATACDPAGTSALARDAKGRIMVIRRHGNRFAGRVLDEKATARTNGSSLIVDCAERRFGAVEIALEEAQAWADAINALSVGRDA
jgi:hypothetical protein